jgi:hypothetical protein
VEESPDIDMVSWLLMPPGALSAMPVSPPRRLSPEEHASTKPTAAAGSQRVFMVPPL